MSLPEGSYKFRWSDTIRWAIHLPMGAILAHMVMRVNPLAGLAATVLFIAYEALEDWRVADRSFKDIFGTLVMFVAGVYILWIWF
jgi:hypothetical protein